MRTNTWSRAAVRAGIAALIAAGAFGLFGNAFHGACLVPYHVAILFFVLPVVFLISFIWFVSEVVRPLLVPLGLARAPTRLLAVAVGAGAYALVAWMVWRTGPTTDVVAGDAAMRWLASAFWSVGILANAGNFSDYSCGY